MSTRRITEHLRVLVEEIGARPPGSAANRRATDYVHGILEHTGLAVNPLPFTCRYWVPGDGTLTVGGERLAVNPNPFSQPCDVTGPLVWLRERGELHDGAQLRGAIVILSGELAEQQVMPKAFPFFNPAEHQELVALLERQEPLAVLAVSPAEERRTPVFEDGDLVFPSATVPPSIGARLEHAEAIRLQLGGSLHAGEGVNLVGSSRGDGPRVVVSAHVDSKVTTPGAFDNAGGVAVLLAVAEAGIATFAPVDIVVFNGEDHYAAPGEQVYLAATDLRRVALNVNIDGAGLIGRDSTVAALACPPALEQRVGDLVESRTGWSVVEPWYESDHSIFAMQGIPSLAVTSQGVHDLLATVAHTEADTLELVDPERLTDVAEALLEWLPVLRTERLLDG